MIVSTKYNPQNPSNILITHRKCNPIKDLQNPNHILLDNSIITHPTPSLQTPMKN